MVYSRQQYCIVQRAECRPRRAVLDGLRWRSPDAADSWIDRAPSPRRLRSMRRRRSIHHDRPPLTPDASISTTPPNQCKSTLTRPPVFSSSSCFCVATYHLYLYLSTTAFLCLYTALTARITSPSPLEFPRLAALQPPPPAYRSIAAYTGEWSVCSAWELHERYHRLVRTATPIAAQCA